MRIVIHLPRHASISRLYSAVQGRTVPGPGRAPRTHQDPSSLASSMSGRFPCSGRGRSPGESSGGCGACGRRWRGGPGRGGSGRVRVWRWRRWASCSAFFFATSSCLRAACRSSSCCSSSCGSISVDGSIATVYYSTTASMQHGQKNPNDSEGALFPFLYEKRRALDRLKA